MIERRKHPRRPILETFLLGVVIPLKGPHRLSLTDLSEGGMGFDADIEGEPHSLYPIRIGDTIQAELYLNQSLYVPLQIKVMRLTQENGIRKLGVEYLERSSPGVKAVQSFLKVLDQLTEVGKVKVTPAH